MDNIIDFEDYYFFFQNMDVGCAIYGSLTHKDCSRTRTASFMPGPRIISSPQLGTLYLPTRHLRPSFQLGRLVRPDGEMRIPIRPAWQGKQQNLMKLQKHPTSVQHVSAYGPKTGAAFLRFLLSCSKSVHILHMSKPVLTFVFQVLRNGLLRCMLYTCPNL